MNIGDAIRKARETQKPSSDGFNAIKRLGDSAIILISTDDDCIPLDDELCRKTNATVGANFSTEDLMADDWEVLETAPEPNSLFPRTSTDLK